MAKNSRQRCGFGRTIVVREFLTELQNNLCGLCGRPNPDTIDHIKPWVFTKNGDISNLLAAHASCNKNKGCDYRVPLITPEFTMQDWFTWLHKCFISNPLKYWSAKEIDGIKKYKIDKMWRRRALIG